MNCRQRSALIFNRIIRRPTESIREIESATSIPKSTVHRQIKNQRQRVGNVGHPFFETPMGQEFFHLLVTGVIFVFGIQSGVGSDTIALFFKQMKLDNYVAVPASSIRTQKRKMRELIDKYGADFMPLIMQLCEHKALNLSGDETFFDNAQILILMELTSGFIFTEALVQDRTESTWRKHSDKFFKFFKNITSFISDGGKVLVGLGKSIGHNGMDLFHLLISTPKGPFRPHPNEPTKTAP